MCQMQCSEALLRKKGGKAIQCPECREVCQRENIFYGSDLQDAPAEGVKRIKSDGWGTKVDSLVAEVLSLPPSAKCLIFSQWEAMLDIVCSALQANGIIHIRLQARSEMVKLLAKFRAPELAVRCLALPFKHGAEGLTLIEATHVFMLEPLLSYALDSQAINRVYRLGQTNPTFVHRFIVADTIEEKIDLLRRRSTPTDSVGEAAAIAQAARAGEFAAFSTVQVASLFSL
jgi:E3 ubiquitin-protein ligase SHPRH